MPPSMSSAGSAGPCAEQGHHVLAHEALFYGSDEEYLDGIMRFIRPGLAAREPVAMALPPQRVRDGRVSRSHAYRAGVPPGCDRPLKGAPQLALALRFDIGRLAVVRRLVGRHAAAAGLDDQRTYDLVLAVDEVASNTIKH